MTDKHAFDALAGDYDRDFTETPIAQFLRAETHRQLASLFIAGANVLEMGCGTGEDARFLAGRGVYVTATDPSTAMLDITRRKTADTARVRVAQLDLNALESRALNARYDGAYSSFGAWNCVHDRAQATAWLAQRVKAGGALALGIMSPLCAWEIGWHVLKGKFDIAFRRWRVSEFAPDPQAPPVRVTCPSIRTLKRELAPYFTLMYVQPLGLFLPPTALYGVLDKRPQWRDRLMRWERVAMRQTWLALLADHYWAVFRRTNAS